MAVAHVHRCKGARKPSQHRIEHVLRTAFAVLRALRQRLFARHRRVFVAADFPPLHQAAGNIDIVLRVIAGIGRGLDVGDDSPAAAELHGPYADQILTRLDDGAVGLFDHKARDLPPAEIARQREPDRPGADNQNVRFDVDNVHHAPKLECLGTGVYARGTGRKFRPAMLAESCRPGYKIPVLQRFSFSSP